MARVKSAESAVKLGGVALFFEHLLVLENTTYKMNGERKTKMRTHLEIVSMPLSNVGFPTTGAVRFVVCLSPQHKIVASLESEFPILRQNRSRFARINCTPQSFCSGSYKQSGYSRCSRPSCSKI
jgi:hypothetical protein